MMFFIMLPCYLIVAGAFIFSMNYIAKPNGNLLLGVKIPKDQMKDPEVLKMVEWYKKEEKRLNLIMLALLGGGFFLRDYSIISAIYSLVWIFLYLGGMQLLFFRSYDKMYGYKRRQGWMVGEQYKVTYAYQSKSRLTKRTDSLWHWAFIGGMTAFGCYAIGWGIRGLFPSRGEDGMVIIVVATSISILFCTVLFYEIYKVNERRRILNEIEAATEEDVVDDDVYWRGGLYNNPHDPKLWVEKRSGIGLQMNGAKPATKVFNTVITLLMVGMFVWLVTLIPLDFPSLSLHITGDTIYVEATRYNTEIKIEDIEKALLIDELPKMYRNEGYSDKNYDFGKFRVIGYGQSKVYINDTISPYLVVYVEDKIYIINSDKEEELQECITNLTQVGKLTVTQ